MSEILKLPQLPEDQGVTEMKIRTRRIDAEFDAQRPAEREFLAKLRLADDLRAALLEKGKGFVRLHVERCRDRSAICFCSTIRAPARS